MQKPAFSLRDVILLALLSLIFGALYWGFGFIYNLVTIILTPIGWGPAANDLLIGLWCMAGPLAAILLQRAGAALISEFMSAFIEMIFGSQWGAVNLLSGLFQGLGSEAGFALTGYKNFSRLGIFLNCLTLTIATFVWDWFKNGYQELAPHILIGMTIMRFGSILFFDGLLILAIQKLLKQSQVLSK